ncbi:MAG TPA: extracellular solute-binding protein [Nitrososphaeraceae archaeon]|nr:extracellular solute-binding protein [Nitrososphaeraceae archaeon]
MNFNLVQQCGSNGKQSAVPIIIVLILLLGLSILAVSNLFVLSYAQKQQQVNLTGLFVDPEDRWKMLIPSALNELRMRHPNLNIQINYTVYPYNDARTEMLKSMANGTAVDLISLDQIWLGEFANKSYIVDLTNSTKSWGGLSDWYQANLDGNLYDSKIYGIWAWTDIRSIWYWKDLLNQSGVDPNSLKTWDGYIQSAKKLNSALEQRNISGIELVGGPGSQNEWYPFLWMLGGEIITQKSGHPSKGVYWFPTYNSTNGVKALEFFKQLIDANVNPITINFEKEFADKNYAEMLGGSWLPGYFPNLTKQDIEDRIGMIPMFPVPTEGTDTASIMGGWLLSIPQTSIHKDLAWELITIMLKPEILSPVLAKLGYLPTQVAIGEGPYSTPLRNSIPYYDELINLIFYGHARPNIPEYPLIADHVRQAIDAVYNGTKTPKEALDDAAEKSAKSLGW